jgi:AcrR family transcriptional regulator
MALRAEQTASTREDIIAAAIELYRERGIASTSIKDVALRADVARATVLNHFGDRDALAGAALDRIAESLAIPTENIFDGARSTPERVQRLVVALFDFYDRSTPWFELLRGERESTPAFIKGEQRFWEGIQPLFAKALGPLARDRLIYRTIFGLTNPAILGALRQSGLSLGEASSTIADVLAEVLNRRRPRRRHRVARVR